MHRFLNHAALFLLNLFLFTSLFAREPAVMKDSVAKALVRHHADSLLNGPWFRSLTGYQKTDSTSILSVTILKKPDRIWVHADKQLAYAPFREATVDSLLSGIRSRLGAPYDSYEIELFSDRVNIRTLVPNHYRSSAKLMDRNRTPGQLKRKSPPLVSHLSRPHLSRSALHNINIALWHSHGWYYEPKLNRWEWQRARIFQTVEDIYPLSYTLPFLVPMLENAGATVLMPRERDWQVHEVIVDNDGSSGNSLYVAPEYLETSVPGSGFGLGFPPYVNENPFRLGSYQTMQSDRQATGSIQWIPEIPETGDYAVYVSYQASPQNSSDALYRVHHSGGMSEFNINQQMGGGTWIYLGRFRFEKGIHTAGGRVVLLNQGARRGKTISADAVKFGGGMGNISRNGFTSQRPRYQEGARYYLQYAGMPDTLVWKLNDSNDYNDDYQSRGEWVNYLMGAPSGPAANRQARGLGIPVDLSLAFHTDAGITGNDTVIGTLGIYSTTTRGGVFPGGLSKMASRDLTDLVQSQIVEDLRAVHDPAWTRRGMWDRGYSEAFRPNVPTMLLELFSHQNFIDMRFGQEPMFRFHVSRAIYKGILKFLDTQYGTRYTVQPLPVDHFQSGFDGDGNIVLSWKAVSDPLEPTAEAESFIVYTRINGGGYDRGTAVSQTRFVLDQVQAGAIYSFKVCAVNRGGESFPSEELSIGKAPDSKGSVAIINAFDRTSGPAWFDDTKHAGFMNMVDQGVPYLVDLHTVGDQFDFSKESPWLDDDSPGHGASYANLETRVIPGNSFNFSYIHGLSILKAGYSFVSFSDEAVSGDSLDLSGYALVDYLAGEERSTWMPKNDSVCHYQVWSPGMLNVLDAYLKSGGALFVTGAHIASDMHMQKQDSVAGSLFKFKWRTSNASRLGLVYSMDPVFAEMDEPFHFNTDADSAIYTVEGADALEPADSTAITLMRYSENNMSAGVAFRGEYGIVALGFPFETLVEQEMRDLLMSRTINYLLKKKDDE
ncbi:MAG: xanthan lyase [Bacteroidales bacterium]|nr:xanthan lyase [Bacteroidales bacterium]